MVPNFIVIIEFSDISNLDSIASWFCIGYTGNFGYGTVDHYVETDAPDRSKCIHKWIEDVEQEVSIQ